MDVKSSAYLARRFSNVQAALVRLDATFEAIEGEGVRAESDHQFGLWATSNQIGNLARMVQAAHPDEDQLVAELSKCSRELARMRGVVQSAIKANRSYAEGWGDLLDDEIKVVGQAIDMLLGTK